MNDPGLFDPEFDLTGFLLLNRLTNFKSYCSDFGVRHETSRPQDFPELSHASHQVRRGDYPIKFHPSPFDFFDELIRTRIIGACIQGFLLLFALGKNKNANRFPQTVGAGQHFP